MLLEMLMSPSKPEKQVRDENKHTKRRTICGCIKMSQNLMYWRKQICLSLANRHLQEQPIVYINNYVQLPLSGMKNGKNI